MFTFFAYELKDVFRQDCFYNVSKHNGSLSPIRRFRARASFILFCFCFNSSCVIYVNRHTK